MKIKVVLIRLFTVQGVRDELLAKADGVEYVSKGGSSLTVITRTKSNELTTKRSEALSQMDWGNNSEINGLNRLVSNGEMRIDDDEDDEGMSSPGKQSLFEHHNLLDASPISQNMLKKNFTSPFGVGGNDALPSIFGNRPKLDPRMLMTPSALNKVAFPRVQDIPGANAMINQFDEGKS